jgi:aryl-alcohol dehydrogenase-like predicted oxidoreductase
VDLVDAKPQENNMQTVTLGATRLEVTPIAYGTWQFGFQRNLEVVAALRRFAADRGATIGQLAVAWVLAHPAVQVAIVGARTPAHLDESAGAAELRLSQDDLAEIDRIMAAVVTVGGPSPEGMT